MGMTEHARASREDELPGGKALCAGLMDEDAARAEGDAVGPGEAVDGGEHGARGDVGDAQGAGGIRICYTRPERRRKPWINMLREP